MAFDAERVRATWLPYSRVIDLSPFVFVSNTTQHMLDLIVAVLCRIVSYRYLSVGVYLSIHLSAYLSHSTLASSSSPPAPNHSRMHAYSSAVLYCCPQAAQHKQGLTEPRTRQDLMYQ